MSALQTRHERQRETERERERERERGREGGRNGRKKNFIISCDSKGDERGRNCRAQNAHTCICIYISYRAQCTALREIYAALNLYIIYIYIYIYIYTHTHTHTDVHTYIHICTSPGNAPCRVICSVRELAYREFSKFLARYSANRASRNRTETFLATPRNPGVLSTLPHAAYVRTRIDRFWCVTRAILATERRGRREE